MYFWIAAICICSALLIHYLCSSKILRVKQAISIKRLARRDMRSEGDRLAEQKTLLENQQRSLTLAIARLQSDAKQLMASLGEKGLEVPDPDFPLAELEGLEAATEDTAAEDTDPESASEE